MGYGVGVTLVMVVLLQAADVQGQERAPVYVAEGACPFECCTYGRWQADEAVYLLTVPHASAGIVAEISVGDSVLAETGEVRTVPAPFVFETDRALYMAGDTVWVLDYLGEGQFRVLAQGEETTAFLGFSPYGARGRALLGENRSEWWVRIRTDAEVVGWTSHTDGFAGRDACSRS